MYSTFFFILAVIVLALGLVGLWVIASQKKKLGVLTQPPVSVDLLEQPADNLYATSLPLVGRPDYILKHRDFLIPIEVKTGRTPTTPYFNHIMQLIAYCVLITESYQVRPPYGIIKYPEREFQINFTEKYEDMFRNIARTMLAYKAGGKQFSPEQNMKWLCGECKGRLS